MQKGQITEIKFVRIETDSRIRKSELIATESILELVVDGKHETSFSYSIGFEEQLVCGYLLTSGIIKNQNEIEDMKFVGTTCNVSISSKVCINQEDPSTRLPTVSFSQIQEARENLLKNQQHHKATRGFHGVILYELPSRQWFVCEDIGRHNAVDKAIGYCYQKGYSLSNSLLLISGRLTADIVQKGVNVGIPIIASITVATDKGIEIAIDSKTTLIGSLSERDCWLYHEGTTKVEII